MNIANKPVDAAVAGLGCASAIMAIKRAEARPHWNATPTDRITNSPTPSPRTS